jgi:hypothetical protein
VPRRWFVPLLALITPAACGPSVQSIHEGNVRFEHCYRLDLELDVAPGHRQACWKTWLGQYTYGQPRDRLEYARRRVRSIATGDASRLTLDLGSERREESRQFYLVVPAPTSVHAPPPPIATRMNLVESAPAVSAGASPPAASAAGAPGEPCAQECRAAFQSCGRACQPEATSTTCASCEPDYKKCMQRCFQ